MEQQPADEGREHDQPTATNEAPAAASGETAPVGQPWIYLADASPGRPAEEATRGIWINAAVDEHELEQAVHDLLRDYPATQPQAYRIGAAVGFHSFQLREHDSLATVSRVACGIVRHGPAFAAYAQRWGTTEEAIQQFQARYEGSWPSLAAWGEAMADRLGLRQALEQVIEPHLRLYVRIDGDQLGRDLAHHVHLVHDQDQLHIFRLAP